MLRPAALPLERKRSLSSRPPNHDFESLSTPPRSPRSQLLHSARAAGASTLRFGPRRRRALLSLALVWLILAGLHRLLIPYDPYGSLDTPPSRLSSLARRWLLVGPAYAFFSDTRARDRGGHAFAREHDAHDDEEEGLLNFDVGLFEGIGEEEEHEHGVEARGVEAAEQLMLEDGIAVADYTGGREVGVEPIFSSRTGPPLGQPINVNPNPKLVPTDDWSTHRYLSYEPHSGLHNQRIALANALTLSRLLNRTLLVPPATLGRALPWTPNLNNRTVAAERAKAGLIPLGPDVNHTRVERRALEDVDLWTPVAWDYLLNPSIFDNASIVDRWNSSAAWLEAGREEGGLGLGIGPEDTIHFEDTERRTWRLFDRRTTVTRLDGFAQRLDIDDLLEGEVASKRLLRFGSMFGSRKLSLRKKENKAMYDGIVSRMVLADERLNRIADGIERLLGEYVAVHLRVGDNFYRAGAQQSILSILRRLVLDVFGLEPAQYTSLLAEASVRHASPDPHAHPHAGAFAFRPELASGLTCRGDPYPPGHPAEVLNRPVYVATDSRDPVNDPDLALFFCMLPCAFVLGDFVEHVPALGEMVRGEDGRGVSGWDGAEVGKWLYGLLEGGVAGRAGAFVGNQKSTFSGYVERVLQPHYRQVRAERARVAGQEGGGGGGVEATSGSGAGELRD